MAAKKTNGANGASNAVSSTMAFLQSPGANSFLLSQKLALEATRFWARRLHAYAEQMETLASCREPREFASANVRFFEKLREDYALETTAIAELLTPPIERVEQDAVVD